MVTRSLDARRLALFISAYRVADYSSSSKRIAARSAWAARLSVFLDAYREIRPVAPLIHPPPRPIEPARLEALISAMRESLAAARDAGVLLNPWAMAGLGRYEVRNAAVLANFLSPNRCGRVAIDLLDALLDPLRSHSNIPSRAELDAGYHVRTEHRVTCDGRDRVDLTIEGAAFVLGIEVKIDAAQGPAQLERYVESITAWGRRRGKRAAVIFLAPYPSGRNDVADTDWRAVTAAARSVVPARRSQRSETQRLLYLYARHAAKF